jgi:hypothetical protein
MQVPVVAAAVVTVPIPRHQGAAVRRQRQVRARSRHGVVVLRRRSRGAQCAHRRLDHHPQSKGRNDERDQHLEQGEAARVAHGQRGEPAPNNRVAACST